MRFAVLNRTGNPIVEALLGFPLHGLLPGRIALITVTGRRSGRRLRLDARLTHQQSTGIRAVLWVPIVTTSQPSPPVGPQLLVPVASQVPPTTAFTATLATEVTAPR